MSSKSQNITVSDTELEPEQDTPINKFHDLPTIPETAEFVETIKYEPFTETDVKPLTEISTEPDIPVPKTHKAKPQKKRVEDLSDEYKARIDKFDFAGMMKALKDATIQCDSILENNKVIPQTNLKLFKDRIADYKRNAMKFDPAKKKLIDELICSMEIKSHLFRKK